MISVELAHGLNSDFFNQEHQESLLIFKELQFFDVTEVCVLVDNYNFNENNFKVIDLIKCCEHFKINVKYLVYEQILSQLAPQWLDSIQDSKKICNEQGIWITEGSKKILIWSNRHQKYTCAGLTALWYLSRFNIVELGFDPADHLINILPQKFQDNEKKVLRIFEILYPKLVNKITWYFY